jgi:DNA-binding transcriptional LysR family regulator
LCCAAPAYLARHGTPQTLADLAAHDCLRLVRGQRVFDRWLFVEDGRRREIQVRGTLSTASGEVLHDWALKGRGLALKALWDIEDDLRAGRLVECLAPITAMKSSYMRCLRPGGICRRECGCFLISYKGRLA